MEKEQDFIDYLFEKREDDAKLKSRDDVLKNYSKIMDSTEKELSDYIDKRINPKCKERLEKLIEKREISFYDYFFRESQLFYKCGFTDALKMILSVVLFDDKSSI